MREMLLWKRLCWCGVLMGVLLVLTALGSFMLRSTAAKAADLGSGTVVERSATGPQIPVGQKGSVTATCEAGEQLLSGGYSLSAFESANVVENYPSSSNEWTVTVDNTYAPSWVTITAFAYCLQSDYSLGTGIVHTSGTDLTTAVCPENAIVTGGGFQSSHVSVSEATEDARGWRSTATEVYAVCATENLPSVYVAYGKAIISPFGGSSGSAACEAGYVATGGGFNMANGYSSVLATVRTTDGWSITLVRPYQEFGLYINAVCIALPASAPDPGETPTPLPEDA